MRSARVCACARVSQAGLARIRESKVIRKARLESGIESAFAEGEREERRERERPDCRQEDREREREA